MCLGYGFNRYSSSKPTWQKRLDACQKIFRHLRHQSHRIMIVILSKLKILFELIIVNLPGNDFILLILANREYGIFSIVSHSTVWIVPCMVSLRLKEKVLASRFQPIRSQSLKHHFKMDSVLLMNRISKIKILDDKTNLLINSSSFEIFAGLVL